MISSELEIPLLTLLSPFHRIFMRIWCVVWFTAHGAFPVWHHWWSWVDCRGSCDHREELQVSHSHFQGCISLTIARKEKKMKKFVFKNLCTSAYGFWLKIGSVRRTNCGDHLNLAVVLPDGTLSSFLPTPRLWTALWGRLCLFCWAEQLDEAGFSQNGCVVLLDTSSLAITPLRNKLPDLIGRAWRDREMQEQLKCLGWCSIYLSEKLLELNQIQSKILKVTLVKCFTLALAWWDVSYNLVCCRCSGSQVGQTCSPKLMLHLKPSFQLTTCSCSLGEPCSPSLEYLFFNSSIQVSKRSM